MFRRAWQLLKSNYGRDFGWYVELDGTVVGELTDPQWAEMFWDSYAIKSVSPESDSVLFDRSNWLHVRFRFRNRVLSGSAPGAFSGGSRIVEGRITMRGLYIRPTRWEGWAIWFLDPCGGGF
jgi:hypothetical protein